MKAWKVIKCPLLHFSHKEAEIREWVARVRGRARERIPALWAVILTLIGLIHHHVFLTDCELKHCNLINTPCYEKSPEIVSRKKTAELFLDKNRNQYINIILDSPQKCFLEVMAKMSLTLNTTTFYFSARVDIHMLQMMFQIIFPSNLDGQLAVLLSQISSDLYGWGNRYLILIC